MATNLNGYTIAVGKEDVELIRRVTELIGKGWRPIGGAVPTLNQRGEPVLMQTLVRSAEDNPSLRRAKGE